MPASGRYEILEKIAGGDFATVYRGRDHELSREVAIKQIHQQYLADPRQLDRYWQEAQLLASLQHPHVMTIYDVVRDRGWLILELMNGSLSQLLAGRPIDLKDLRLTLNFTLQALQAMHRCGILHGDIKPSNLLVDRNQRVKLGDFGIARHITGEGSVVKGTTKYIAPEVVSDQFGPVGPHSDLYSLGFTAYELICGEHFETLFPGLNTYGRDRQMAWMMWHSAVDRRLPEISRVLDGVPADLAHIVQKLTEKVPAKRYRTTDEVLADLKFEGAPPPVTTADAEEQAPEGRTDRRRSLAIGALACSLVLSVGMLFLPTESPPKENPKPRTAARPTSGEVVEVDRERGRLFVKPADGEPQAIVIRDGQDRVFLNGQRVSLEQLDIEDRVQIATSARDGQEFLMIEASRAAAEEARGPVLAVEPASRTVTVRHNDQELRFLVGEHVTVEINGQTKKGAIPFGLPDLIPQDDVMVRYKAGQEPPQAALIKATRLVKRNGVIDQVDAKQLTLKAANTKSSASEPDQVWPLHEKIVVTINGETADNGRAFTVADLRAGDAVAIEHDTILHRISVSREIEIRGSIASLNREAKTITISVSEGDTATIQIAPQTRMTIAGTKLECDFALLRPGDELRVRRKSPDPSVQEVASVVASLLPDQSGWAFVMEQSEYDNPKLPKPAFIENDATELHSALRFRYRIPESQCLRERNATRLKLETTLTEFLARVPADAQVMVFCLGLGFVDSNGRGFIAPQGFDEQRAEATGISVRWLIDQMEKSQGADKLLVLDTSHKTEQVQRGGFASAAELAETSRPSPRRPLSATVAVLASSSAGEMGYKLENQKQGAFAAALIEAYSGKADKDANYRISSQELAEFVGGELPRLRGSNEPAQTPIAFWPDPKPARLSAEAKTAVLRLFEYLSRPAQEVAKLDFEEAAKLCSGQPDAHLAYALVAMKNDKTLIASQVLEQVRIAHPDHPATHEMLAWLAFRRGESKPGVASLERLIRKLPDSAEASDQEFSTHAASFAGRLTGYGMFIAPVGRRLAGADVSGLAAALKLRPTPIQTVFRDQYRAAEQVPAQIERRIADTVDPQAKSLLEQQRTNFNFHVPFDYDAMQRFLKANLEQ